MALKSFPKKKTFRLNELKKDISLTISIKNATWDTKGPYHPNKHSYKQMKPDERSKFLKWYDERVNEKYVFDFQKEIIENCRSDVDILRRSMIKL